MLPIVCDTGTGYLKIGRCDSSYPEYTIPCVVGRPNNRYLEMIDDHSIENVFVI
jgi:actin-related protein